MRTVEQIVEQIRADSGADFAFVLTRKGRLVTYRAPRDMPEVGRNRLVRAARPIVGTDGVVELMMAREELVPYGGAAPVDVYVGVAAEQAIVCMVLATWADKARVAPALVAGLRAIEPLLRRGLPTPQRRSVDIVPAKGSPWVGDRRANATSVPPAPAQPLPLVAFPRAESLPSIHIGEAELGRASLAAIQHHANATASSPEITFGETVLGRQSMVAVRREVLGNASAPEIIVRGEAALGRETLAAIDLDTRPRVASSPDAIRVELVTMPDDILLTMGGDAPRDPPYPPAQPVTMGGAPTYPPAQPEAERAAARRSGVERLTVPWVELPGDTKRAADAAVLGRKLAPPKVTLKLEEADDGVIDATREELSAPPARAPQPTMAFDKEGPPPTEKPVSPRQPQRTIGFDSGSPVLPPLPAKPARR